MIARLLLALLLAAFAVPGAAPVACHAMPAVGHTMPMPAGDDDHRAAPSHGCIGCVPPSDWQRTPVAAPPVVAATKPSPRPAAALTGTGRTPDLPPPRRG